MFGLGNGNATRRPVGNRGGTGMLRTAALAGLGMMAYRWFRNRQATTASAGARGTPGQYDKTTEAAEATDPKDVW